MLLWLQCSFNNKVIAKRTSILRVVGNLHSYSDIVVLMCSLLQSLGQSLGMNGRVTANAYNGKLFLFLGKVSNH
jgi:hypothetical protein